MTIGTMIAFVSYCAQMRGVHLADPATSGRVLTELGKTLVAIGRIQEVLKCVPEETTPDHAIELPLRARGELVLVARELQALATSRSLEDVSLTIPTGKTIALAGSIGRRGKDDARQSAAAPLRL